MAIEAARLFVSVGSDTRQAEQGLQSFDQRLNTAARNLTMTGGLLTAGVTLPLVAIGRQALSSAADFEQSMNVLQQVSGASADQMELLNDQALELGAQTSFSAGEAAAAMLELGKAGMGTEAIMASIGGVLDLAAAGGVGLAEAAGLTAATLNAFHLEASESSRVANLLAAAANASAADISDLGAGMQQAGFAFSMANQPVDNLAASLAILTNVGLTGSDAGTALKNAFMRMMNPTQEAADLMNELGINFYDAQGAMLPLPEIIDNLNSATAGLTDEQRDQALATIFLSDGMKAMIPLMDAGKSGFEGMLEAVNESGAATEVANARMSGLAGGIEYLRGSLDSFLIGAAMPFLGVLGDMARGVGDAITWFGELPQPVMDATLAFLGILAGAGPVIAGLGALAAALSFLISPIGLVVGAVALLGAAWAADLGGIQEITANALGTAQEWFASTLSGAQSLASGIETAFSNTEFPSLQSLWEDFRAGDFERLATTIRNTAFDLMVNLDTELNITGRAQDLWSRLQEGASAVQQWGTNMVTGLTGQINAVDWSQASLDLAGMMNSWSEKINSFDWSEIGTSVASSLRTAIVAVFSFFSFSDRETLSVTDGLKSATIGALTSIHWGELTVAYVGLLKSAHSAIASTISGFEVEWRNTLTQWGVNIATGLTNRINEVDWSTTSLDFAGMVTHWSEQISAIDWTDVGTNLAASIKGVVGAVFTFFTMPAEDAAPVAEGLKQAIVTALTDIQWGELGSAFSGLGQAIADAITGMVAGLTAEFDWGEYVPDVSWEDFVPDVTWDDFVPDVRWSNFVPDISWNSFIPDISWSSFIPDISWDSFIPDIPGFASGTSSAPGGLALVGEQGPELVRLPRGAQVFDSGETRGILAGAGGGGESIVVQFTGPISISNGMDIEQLTLEIAKRLKRRMRI